MEDVERDNVGERRPRKEAALRTRVTPEPWRLKGGGGEGNFVEYCK